MYFGKHFLCVVRLLSRTLPLCGLCTCKNTTSANVFKIHYLCFAHIISKQLHVLSDPLYTSPLCICVLSKTLLVLCLYFQKHTSILCVYFRKQFLCVGHALSKTLPLCFVHVLSKTLPLRWVGTFKTLPLRCPCTFKNTL